MRVIAKRTIVEFYTGKTEFDDARGQLEAWYAEPRSAHRKNPVEVKEQYRNASILKSNRIVFNICGINTV